MDTHDLYTKSIIRLDFWKGLLKGDSSELSFELREDVEIRKLAGNEFQTDGAMKLKGWPTGFRLCSGIFKRSWLEGWRRTSGLIYYFST